jgi:hypothetical protein
MIELNSRVSQLSVNARQYVTSESGTSEWGQPSASQYVFVIQGRRLLGKLLAGIYLSSAPDEIQPISLQLAAELAAWDALSDEALMNFESSLH